VWSILERGLAYIPRFLQSPWAKRSIYIKADECTGRFDHFLTESHDKQRRENYYKYKSNKEIEKNRVFVRTFGCTTLASQPSASARALAHAETFEVRMGS
jgi:ATPase subunit of ABC transporter with duplicated ATPase domains